MKNLIILASATSALVAILTTVLVFAEPQLAGMTNAQRSTLKSLGIRIVVPGYTPPGFQVVRVITEPLRGNSSNIGRPNYNIIYHSPSNACFAITGTSGGIGDDVGEYETPVTSKLLGSTLLKINTGVPDGSRLYRQKPSLEQLRTPQVELITGWLAPSPSGPSYHLISGSDAFSYSDSPESLYTRGCATSITPLEAVQIVESLWSGYLEC